MVVLNTRAYVSSLRELTEAGEEVNMKIFGGSMAPFLGDGRDEVLIKKPDHALKVGDIVFFERDNGSFILHRIVKKKEEGYYIVGDSQQEIEGPIRENQIFAVVTKAKRKGKWICPGNFWWEFFEHVWLHMIPFRRICIKAYIKLRKG